MSQCSNQKTLFPSLSPSPSPAPSSSFPHATRDRSASATRLSHDSSASSSTLSPTTLLLIEVVFLGLMLLFFYQLFLSLVSGIFARALQALALPIATLAILCFLSPILFIAFNHYQLVTRHGKALTYSLALLVLVFRAFVPHFGVAARVAFSSLGTACSLLFFLSWMSQKKESRLSPTATIDDMNALSAGTSLALSVILSVLLRSLDITVDASYDWYHHLYLIGIFLVFLAFSLLLLLWFQGEPRPPTEDEASAPLSDHDFESVRPSSDAAQAPSPAIHDTSVSPSSSSATAEPQQSFSFVSVVLLCISWLSTLALVLFCLQSPTVISRWGNCNFLAINTLVSVTAALYILVTTHAPTLHRRLKAVHLIHLNVFLMLALLVASLTPFAMVQRDGFSYVQAVATYLVVLLSPVLYVQFSLTSSALTWVKISTVHRAVGFTLSALVFFLYFGGSIANLGSSYVGIQVFRNLFWLILVLAVVAMMVGGVISIRVWHVYSHWHETYLDRLSTARVGFVFRAWRLAVLLILLVLVITTVVFTAISLPSPNPPNERIRVGDALPKFSILTYNLLTGFTERDAKPSFHLLAEHLKEDAFNADIMCFQESDTAKIATGNQDLMRFLTSKLNYYSYYGPKPTCGTYGISVLSRFPIERATTHFLPSKNEQIACIDLVISLSSSQKIRLLVTHFGFRYEEDQLSQVSAVMDIIRRSSDEDKSLDMLLACDCNFTPLSAPYNATVEAFQDAYGEMHNGGTTPDDYTWSVENPRERVDYVWVHRDSQLQIQSADILKALQDSDHYPVRAELSWG